MTEFNITNSYMKKMDDEFSPSNEIIRGGFLGALANLGRIILPFVSKFAPKVLPPLASGAVNALGSL